MAGSITSPPTAVVKDWARKLAGFALLAGFCFGLFALVVAPIEMWKKKQAEAWPSRPAVVTSAQERHHRGSAGRHAGAPYWTAEICGRYSNDGEKFCVARIRLGGIRWGDGKASARASVERYRVGQPIAVYHAPDNPKDTVLEALSSWDEMLMLFGLGVFFFVLPFVLWALRKKIEPLRYDRG